MVKIALKQGVMLFFSFIVLGCAASGERSLGDPEGPLPRGTDCISQLTVRDYTVLDNSNLLVTGPSTRRYHVVLFQPAYGLRSTWQIGFYSRAGRICPGSSDLVVSNGLDTESYNISSIRELTDEEYDQLLVSFGKKQPEETPDPEPEGVAGAEVEELD